LGDVNINWRILLKFILKKCCGARCSVVG
jgi:hypothetical protein